VFFCYRLPGPDASGQWTMETGSTQWYLYDLANEAVLEDAEAINRVIRCAPDTPRHCTMPKETLVEIRKKVELHIKDTYLKSRQAPAGEKPVLKAWMEVN
jgi:hypothetical protein